MTRHVLSGSERRHFQAAVVTLLEWLWRESFADVACIAGDIAQLLGAVDEEAFPAVGPAVTAQLRVSRPRLPERTLDWTAALIVTTWLEHLGLGSDSRIALATLVIRCGVDSQTAMRAVGAPKLVAFDVAVSA